MTADQTKTFVGYLAKQHRFLPPERRLRLPEINAEVLASENIIELNDGRITALDTTKIAEAYLDLDYEQVDALSDLELLTLSNTKVIQTDVTAMTSLNRIEFHSCRRETTLYIAECPSLKTLDLSLMEAPHDGSFPLTLCATPAQVGSVFPENIEELGRTPDGLLSISLCLAPPGHDKVASSPLPGKWLWRHKEADLGDILKMYWSMQPDYYTTFARVEDCPESQQEEFKQLLAIEQRVGEGFYSTANVVFDARKQPDSQYRDFADTRPVPEYMYATFGSGS